MTSPTVTAVSELKPCPFCGSANISVRFDRDDPEYTFAQCDTCETQGPVVISDAPDARAKTVARWNRRSALADVGECDVMDEHVLNLLNECKRVLVAVYDRCNECDTHVVPTIARLAVTITALEREANAGTGKQPRPAAEVRALTPTRLDTGSIFMLKNLAAANAREGITSSLMPADVYSLCAEVLALRRALESIRCRSSELAKKTSVEIRNDLHGIHADAAEALVESPAAHTAQFTGGERDALSAGAILLEHHAAGLPAAHPWHECAATLRRLAEQRPTAAHTAQVTAHWVPWSPAEPAPQPCFHTRYLCSVRRMGTIDPSWLAIRDGHAFDDGTSTEVVAYWSEPLPPAYSRLAEQGSGAKEGDK